jgi:hypothetical protein
MSRMTENHATVPGATVPGSRVGGNTATLTDV